MSLNEYASGLRRKLFDELKAGQPPSQGTFDESVFKDGKSKGAPQVGTTRFEPQAMHFEFVYPDPVGTTVILTVTVEPPERIVFLPVPGWVIESIWQGDIDGSYHFESDARRLVASFSEDLEPDANQKWFGPRQAKRRE